MIILLVTIDIGAKLDRIAKSFTGRLRCAELAMCAMTCLKPSVSILTAGLELLMDSLQNGYDPKHNAGCDKAILDRGCSAFMTDERCKQTLRSLIISFHEVPLRQLPISTRPPFGAIVEQEGPPKVGRGKAVLPFAVSIVLGDR